MAKMSYDATRKSVIACCQAKTTPHVVGAPGIGKSAMLQGVADELKLELQVVNGGTVADDDIPGTPFVNPRTGNLDHGHRGPFKAAIQRPCLLALDEWSAVPETSHAPALALTLDYRAGDYPLHPDTRVVVLSNPPEQAPGGMRFSAATANRLVTFHMEPRPQEVAAWFQGHPNPYLSELGVFMGHNSELIQMAPTPQDIEAGRTWASPRGWERGIRSFGAYADLAKLDLVSGKSDPVAYALVEGAVGPSAAGLYFAQREQRRHLPPLDAILSDPEDAADKVAKDAAAQIAAVSVLPTLRKQDTGAAWVWASCLQGRYKGAATAVLMGSATWVTGPWNDKGRRAQIKLIAAAVK